MSAPTTHTIAFDHSCFLNNPQLYPIPNHRTIIRSPSRRIIPLMQRLESIIRIAKQSHCHNAVEEQKSSESHRRQLKQQHYQNRTMTTHTHPVPHSRNGIANRPMAIENKNVNTSLETEFTWIGSLRVRQRERHCRRARGRQREKFDDNAEEETYWKRLRDLDIEA